MKNIFITIVMFGFIVSMSCGYAQNYEDYLDDLDEYDDCSSSNFSGGPDCTIEEPPMYDPCVSNFSGGSECTPPEEEPCAVYVIESGNLHLNDVYIEGLKNVDYIKMIHEDGSFYIDEIKIE